MNSHHRSQVGYGQLRALQLALLQISYVQFQSALWLHSAGRLRAFQLALLQVGYVRFSQPCGYVAEVSYVQFQLALFDRVPNKGPPC